MDRTDGFDDPLGLEQASATVLSGSIMAPGPEHQKGTDTKDEGELRTLWGISLKPRENQVSSASEAGRELPAWTLWLSRDCSSVSDATRRLDVMEVVPASLFQRRSIPR